MYSGGGGDSGVGGLGGGLVEADTIIGNSLAGIKMDNNVIRGSGSTSRKQNLMAFNAMDSNNNAKVFKGFSKEGKLAKLL